MSEHRPRGRKSNPRPWRVEGRAPGPWLTLAGLGLCLTWAPLPGCAWTAADGPWNRQPGEASVPELDLRGEVWFGDRPLGPVEVLGQGGVAALSDGAGAFAARGPAGAFELEVAGRQVQGRLTGIALDDDTNHILAVDAEDARALILGDPEAAALEPWGARVRALGFGQVHEPDAEEALLLLEAPQGLGAYSWVLLHDSLDPARWNPAGRAAQNLQAFVLDGGALWLQGPWAAIGAQLAEEATITLLGDEPADLHAAAEITDPTLIEALGRTTVSLPLFSRIEAIPVEDGLDVLVLLDPAGNRLLHRRIPMGRGVLHWTSLRAPPPRDDRWWRGDPSPWSLPDGSWDGRDGVLDHLVLLD